MLSNFDASFSIWSSVSSRSFGFCLFLFLLFVGFFGFGALFSGVSLESASLASFPLLLLLLELLGPKKNASGGFGVDSNWLCSIELVRWVNGTLNGCQFGVCKIADEFSGWSLDLCLWLCLRFDIELFEVFDLLTWFLLFFRGLFGWFVECWSSLLANKVLSTVSTSSKMWSSLLFEIRLARLHSVEVWPRRLQLVQTRFLVWHSAILWFGLNQKRQRGSPTLCSRSLLWMKKTKYFFQ